MIEWSWKITWKLNTLILCCRSQIQNELILFLLTTQWSLNMSNITSMACKERYTSQTQTYIIKCIQDQLENAFCSLVSSYLLLADQRKREWKNSCKCSSYLRIWIKGWCFFLIIVLSFGSFIWKVQTEHCRSFPYPR